MRKCTKTDCHATATRALKLSFYISLDEPPAEAFINLPVCDEHNLTDVEVIDFLRINWNALCSGFMQVGEPLPVRELTEWEWAPIADAEKFWREGVVSAAQRNIQNN